MIFIRSMGRGSLNRYTAGTATLIYFRSQAEWGGGISVSSTLYICSLEF